MAKAIQHVHWANAPDMWMPYAPAIKVKGGTTVYLAGVTAAPVYHHHPHRPEEFDTMPRDMAGQAPPAPEKLKRGPQAGGGGFSHRGPPRPLLPPPFPPGGPHPGGGGDFPHPQP